MFGFDIMRRLYLDAEIILVKPDIIHFEFGTLASERMYLKELLDCKIVVSYRGYDLNFTELNNPNFYNYVWEKADMLHFLGEHLWQVAQERGCPVDKPHVLIPPAVDTAYFQRSSKDIKPILNSPLHILSVGRFEWKKGYEYALQAVKIVVDGGAQCEYHLIGDGAYREALYFARYQLGLDNMTTFIGAQSPDIVKAEMDWADIFLHPSLSEGFCNVVLEAQSMEIPVIASDVGGLKENIEENVTGFFAPPRNPRVLAEKIELLAREPMLQKKMGAAGRNRVLEHFQPDGQILRFENMYLQILKAK